jgi:hypothetical protein
MWGKFLASATEGISKASEGISKASESAGTFYNSLDVNERIAEAQKSAESMYSQINLDNLQAALPTVQTTSVTHNTHLDFTYVTDRIIGKFYSHGFIFRVFTILVQPWVSQGQEKRRQQRRTRGIALRMYHAN